MNEATQLHAPRSANRVWVALKRILAAIVIVIATIGFVSNVAGLVGMWAARGPARDTVTALSASLNSKLEMVDQALARVSARADQGRQALARVNDAASKLGDRIEVGSPALTALAGAIRDDLAPKIADARAQAAALRDGVVALNATLETLDRIPFITVPTLTDELSAVSERVEAAESDVQELRAAIAEARAGASANLVAAVTARTIKIDNGLAQIQATAARHQATVAQKQQQVTDRSNTLLRAIDLVAVSLTVLFLVLAAGQGLLMYVCWQYVRRGRFPSLRVVRG